MGLRSIAVPLSNTRGQVLAALNVGVHAGQVSADELLSRVLPELQKRRRNSRSCWISYRLRLAWRSQFSCFA